MSDSPAKTAASVPSATGSSAKAAPQAEQGPETIVIDLRNIWVAGILAWLWPGAGHIYQRRYSKGLLFMACILSLFFFGLILGDGKVVYAMHPVDQQAQLAGVGWNNLLTKIAGIAPLPYWLQVGAGLPALPAVAQRLRVKNNQAPKGWMAPPQSPAELDTWHRGLNQRFDMGVLYTMIAGVLNLFAIWDAVAGPAPAEPLHAKKKKDDPKKPNDAKPSDDDKSAS